MWQELQLIFKAMYVFLWSVLFSVSVLKLESRHLRRFAKLLQNFGKSCQISYFGGFVLKGEILESKFYALGGFFLFNGVDFFI